MTGLEILRVSERQRPRVLAGVALVGHRALATLDGNGAGLPLGRALRAGWVSLDRSRFGLSRGHVCRLYHAG